jgi:hypothetical protein
VRTYDYDEEGWDMALVKCCVLSGLQAQVMKLERQPERKGNARADHAADKRYSSSSSKSAEYAADKRYSSSSSSKSADYAADKRYTD